MKIDLPGSTFDARTLDHMPGTTRDIIAALPDMPREDVLAELHELHRHDRCIRDGREWRYLDCRGRCDLRKARRENGGS